MIVQRNGKSIGAATTVEGGIRKVVIVPGKLVNVVCDEVLSMNSYERINVIQALANLDDICDFFHSFETDPKYASCYKAAKKAKDCLETALGITKK